MGSTSILSISFCQPYPFIKAPPNVLIFSLSINPPAYCIPANLNKFRKRHINKSVYTIPMMQIQGKKIKELNHVQELKVSFRLQQINAMLSNSKIVHGSFLKNS